MKPRHCIVTKHAILQFWKLVDVTRNEAHIKGDLKHEMQRVRVHDDAPLKASWYVWCDVAGHPVRVTVVWYPDTRKLVAVTVHEGRKSA